MERQQGLQLEPLLESEPRGARSRTLLVLAEVAVAVPRAGRGIGPALVGAVTPAGAGVGPVASALSPPPVAATTVAAAATTATSTTAASIVSGTVAERIKLWPFLIFVVVLTAIIYPIQGSWTWGGGWLADLGFSDFAGSTIVHSVGGWAALAGVMLLGPRRGRFDDAGNPQVLAPSSLLDSTH